MGKPATDRKPFSSLCPLGELCAETTIKALITGAIGVILITCFGPLLQWAVTRAGNPSSIAISSMGEFESGGTHVSVLDDKKNAIRSWTIRGKVKSASISRHDCTPVKVALGVNETGGAGGGTRDSYVLLLDKKGKEAARIRPPRLDGSSNPYQPRFTNFRVHSVDFIDIDGGSRDGEEEIVVIFRNVPFYASSLVTYRQNDLSNPCGVYWHPGYLDFQGAIDLNGDGLLEIVATGSYNLDQVIKNVNRAALSVISPVGMYAIGLPSKESGAHTEGLSEPLLHVIFNSESPESEVNIEYARTQEKDILVKVADTVDQDGQEIEKSRYHIFGLYGRDIANDEDKEFSDKWASSHLNAKPFELRSQEWLIHVLPLLHHHFKLSLAGLLLRQ